MIYPQFVSDLRKNCWRREYRRQLNDAKILWAPRFRPRVRELRVHIRTDRATLSVAADLNQEFTMGTVSSSPSPARETGRIAASALVALRVAWHSVRVPALAVLVVLEPFVSVILSALTVLGIFSALFNRFLLHLPHFPFWAMLGVSVGCATLLMLYYGIIRILSNR